MNIVRVRVREKLMRVKEFPLTLLMAPIGYGKTEVVRRMAEAYDIQIEWYDDTLPAWSAKGGYTEETYVVLDNYDEFLAVPAYRQKLMECIQKHSANLHIVCITRAVPDLPIGELKIKQLCQVIEQEELKFTEQEVKDYFEEHQIELEPEEVTAQYEYVAGWPAGIYLMRNNYRQYGKAQDKQSLYTLIRDGIYNKYSLEEQYLLLLLSCMGQFSIKDMESIGDYTFIREAIIHLMKGNVLIHYNALTESYEMVPAFREFLQEEMRLVTLECYQDICKCAGEWYLNSGEWQKGLEYLIQSKSWDRLLQYIESKALLEVRDIAYDVLDSVLDQVEEQTLMQYPIAHLRLAYHRVKMMSKGAAKEWLAHIQAAYEADEQCAPEMKQKIIGELWAIRGMTVCQEIEEVKESFEWVKRYIPEGSQVIRGRDLLTKESIHLSYFYHTEAGSYQAEVDNLMGKLRYYRTSEKSYSVELEYLLCAEFSMYTGKWEHAKNYAQKAYYKGEMIGCELIKLCAQLILARISLGQGEYKKCQQELIQIENCEAYNQEKELAQMRAVGVNYLYSCLGQQVPELGCINIQGLLEHKGYIHQRMNTYIAQARAFLQAQEWIKLEILVDIMREDWLESGKVFAKLYYYIFTAIISSYYKQWDQAVQALTQAVEIGAQDGLVLPFIEYTRELEPIWEHMQLDTDKQIYIQKLRQVESIQAENTRNEEQSERLKWKLTKREWEVAELIKKGLTNKEIADQLFVANITVAKTTTNIYRKMGVTGRVEMVSALK